MSIPKDGYIGEPGYPAPWTTRTPREGLRDTDQARIVSLSPDVCRSPKKPIPYPVVDFCGHDENYTPSVRFTGQKAMVMRSNTSHVHGDEAGRGRGVISNTVGGISEPITHAAQVRAEGSHVIRHLDRFWMNNRNTVGEAVFVRDTATYPAPQDNDPLPGSMVATAMPFEPYQVAQAATGTATDAGIGSPRTGVAAAPAGQSVGPLLGELATGARLALGRIGPFGVASTGYQLGQRESQRAWSAPEDYMEQEAMRYGGVDSFDSEQMAIYDHMIERLRAGATQGHVRGDFYQQMDAHRARTAVAAPHPDNDNGTRISGLAAAATTPWPCIVGPYREVKGQCIGGEAHHIVPDMALRYGTRYEGMRGINRIPNAPSFQGGMTICLNPIMHRGLHAGLTVALRELGKAGSVRGTATMRSITQASEVSINAIPGLHAECKQRAIRAAQAQMMPLGVQPGRTTIRLPKPDAALVLMRGSY